MKLWILNDYNQRKYYFYRKIVDHLKKEKGLNIEIEIKSKENIWNDIFSFFENPSLSLGDVIEIPHHWTTLFAKLGLSLPLNSFIEEDFTFKIYPFLKQTMVCELTEKFFSLPIHFEVMVMFYKREMLGNILSHSEMEKLKWNDLFILCEKLKKKYRSKDYYPFDNPNLEGYIKSEEILACVMNRTSGYFSSDFTMINIHRDEVIMSVLDFLNLAVDKYYPLFEENFFEIGFIKKNLSSMIFSFRRDIADKNMRVVRFPDIMRKSELGKAHSFMFFSGSKDLGEIKKFIEEFYNPQNLKELANCLGAFSPFKNSHYEIINEKEIKFYEELFEKITFIPNIFIYPTFERMMDEFLKNQAINIVSSKYIAEDVKKRLQEIKVICEYLMTSY
ncbi:MAG: ABC transporter substrate-binding protein [Elusimicrobiales bacterium]|nr:ABC transporter substrate-binding protein [Elusimicrobiales bacterium]